MSKVKKPAKVTSVRNSKGKKGAPATGKGKHLTKRAGAPGRKVAKAKAKRIQPAKRTLKRATKAARPVRKVITPPRPTVRYEVKELDPVRKCGPGTSVLYLCKVTEREDDRVTCHLVYFDRHGWYCEHGRSCPAVAPARKQSGPFARAS